jgi:hypothetical protein
MKGYEMAVTARRLVCAALARRYVLCAGWTACKLLVMEPSHYSCWLRQWIWQFGAAP